MGGADDATMSAEEQEQEQASGNCGDGDKSRYGRSDREGGRRGFRLPLNSSLTIGSSPSRPYPIQFNNRRGWQWGSLRKDDQLNIRPSKYCLEAFADLINIISFLSSA